MTKTELWDGKQKLAVAVPETNGVAVLLFDPQYQELITIHIPKHTEVDVSHRLGIWKIESIWELGKESGVPGELLADSITKHFHFPTTAWADTTALGLASGKPGDLYKAIFGLYKTNLTHGDRFLMAWFSFRLPNSQKREIYLENTGYLRKTLLADGEEGYRKIDPLPQNVLALFADSDIAKSSTFVEIEDRTGDRDVSNNVKQVVEVLGAKILAINTQSEKEEDCIVEGKNGIILQRLAQVFRCDVIQSEDSDSGVVHITLGTKFAQRF